MCGLCRSTGVRRGRRTRQSREIRCWIMMPGVSRTGRRTNENILGEPNGHGKTLKTIRTRQRNTIEHG